MAELGWVRLIRQGVVAHRRGARPTMTILECYNTQIRTLTCVHQRAHIQIVLCADLSLTSTFFIPFAILSSARSQREVFHSS